MTSQVTQSQVSTRATAQLPNAARPTASQVIDGNRNAFGFVDTAALARDIRVLQLSDPAAAEALLKEVEGKLGSGDLGALYKDLGFGGELGATNRIAFQGPQLSGQNNGLLGKGEVYAAGKQKVGGSSVEVGVGYKATQLRGGLDGAALDTNFGRGTIEPGNANANAVSRLANAGGRLFDSTVGRIFNGFDAAVSAAAETSSNLAVKGKLTGKEGVAGLFQEVKAFLRLEAIVEVPFANLQARGNAETSAAAGIGVAKGGGAVQGAVGPVPVFAKLSAPNANTEGRAVLRDNWAGTDLIAQMNAAGAPASSPEAQRVQEKFTVSRSGMLTVNFAGSVPFREGIAAKEQTGTITAALTGDTARLASSTGPVDNALGGKYVDIGDAARFLREIGRQNQGGAFAALDRITPEMLSALNPDKIVTRTVDGQPVTLISQENLRLPIFMSPSGAEFRAVTEGAGGTTRLTPLN